MLTPKRKQELTLERPILQIAMGEDFQLHLSISQTDRDRTLDTAPRDSTAAFTAFHLLYIYFVHLVRPVLIPTYCESMECTMT